MTIKDCWLKFKGCEIGETSEGSIYVQLPNEQTKRLYAGDMAGGIARNVFCDAVDTMFRRYLTNKIAGMGYDPVTGVRDDAVCRAYSGVAQEDIYDADQIG